MTRFIDASYKPTHIKGSHFDVIGSFEIKLQSKSNNIGFLNITCQYTGYFHHQKQVIKADAERFANSEAKVILWPYFRQLVADLSARMHIPPVIIPLTLD